MYGLLVRQACPVPEWASLWHDRFLLNPYKEADSKRTTERPNIWMLVIQFIKKVQEIYLYILLAVNYFIESELSGH